MTEPEFAQPEKSENYNPSDDEQWYQNLIIEKNSKSKGHPPVLLSCIIAVAVVVVLIALIKMPIYSGIVDESEWSEAKVGVGTIKASVDTYKAKMGGDISSLDVPKGTLAEGFVSGSKLLEKLKLEHVSFEVFQYFEAEDYVLEFTTDGKDGFYKISVDVKRSIGRGLSGNGPKSGTGEYDSQTGKYSGNLQ